MAVITPLARFGMNLLVMLDEIGNTLTGGSPNETISSRAGKGRQEGKWFWTILANLLDRIQAGHCERAMSVTIGEDAVISD